MNAVFVDTGGWMACADQSDPSHVACTAANAWWQQIDDSARLRWERVENDR